MHQAQYTEKLVVLLSPEQKKFYEQIAERRKCSLGKAVRYATKLMMAYMESIEEDIRSKNSQ